MRLKADIRLVGGTTEYPAFSILLVMALILLSPFVSAYLCYAAFVICVYRMVRYSVQVFATDYCILIPATHFFRTTDGMTFLIWLCLIAAIWYFLRGRIRANATLVFILALMNYLIARMQGNISDFVLCFGQIFILYTLLPKQDAASAERATKAFCWSLIVTSLYAMALRNTSQIIAVRGPESTAIWGTTIMRFSGLGKDPNYYMTLLITGMASLCKLKEAERISTLHFWGQILMMTAFGIITYSKAFFLMFILLGGTYIVWQFWSKKFFKGIVFVVLGMVAGSYLLLSENSPFAVVLMRLTSGSSLSDITTRRSDLFINYWNAITESAAGLLFGFGLDAPLVNGKGAHNLYLETVYFVGIIGLFLILGFIISMIRDIQKNNSAVKKQSLLGKYAAIAMVAIQYLSLQGLFLVFTYGAFFVAFLTIMIIPAQDKK